MWGWCDQELLEEMERGRSAQQENYWLIQYQKLLDARPQGILEAERCMDPQVSKPHLLPVHT